MKGRELVRHVAAQNAGLIAVSNPDVCRRTVSRMIKDKELVALLPGVVALPSVADHFEVKVRAVALWDRDAVITGRSAARLSFWPRAGETPIDVNTTTKAKSCTGYRLHRSAVPVDHVVEEGSLRISDAAWTSVWLSATDGGEAIEEALRARAMSVREMLAVVEEFAGWRGTATRRELVDWSTLEPWSHFERKVHRILIEAGITGWRGNWCYQPTAGSGIGSFPIDIAFPDLRVAIELNGYEYHHELSPWMRDMRKRNLLELDDWTVLTFCWEDLDDPERFVAQVKDAIRLAEARRRSRRG